MKLSWLVKLSIQEMLKNFFLHLFASKERLVFMGVFFTILWGCERFTACLPNMGVFRGIPESG